MIDDLDPSRRASRVMDLLRSDVPEERELGERETAALIEAAIEGVPTSRAAWAAFYALAEAAPQDAVARPSAHPDTGWRAFTGAGGSRFVRRQNGKILVVREGWQGTYYAVVEGHHLSAHGAPDRFQTADEAMKLAEAYAGEVR